MPEETFGNVEAIRRGTLWGGCRGVQRIDKGRNGGIELNFI